MHTVETPWGPLFQFESLLAGRQVAHAVAARPHNYAPHRGPGRERALAAREAVCRWLGLDFARLTAPGQFHGPQVLAVGLEDLGRGRDGRDSAVPYVDGLISDLPGVPLVLMSADCPLVWVYDPQRPAVGAVHASWHGTVALAAENLVRQMVRVCDSRPERLLAGIAPCAGPCCYEVGREVRRIAESRLADPDACFDQRDGRIYFDLRAANRNQLIAAGLHPDHIEVAGICTICDRRFWSHRRDGPDTGRFALFIGLCP